jgi:hypothetical protein
MRGTLGAAAGRLTVAGWLAGGLIVNHGAAAIDAHAVGGLNTVTVSPAHGKAASAFVVTYAVSPCQGAAGLTIGFSWNALPPAGQLLGTATTDSSCRASLSTSPPINQATHAGPPPGSYQVFGYVALPTGSPTPNTEASAAYTVDVTPTPTSTAKASATAKATSHPTASATSPPTASASAVVGAGASPSVAAGSTLPGQATATVAAHGGQSGGWTLAWRVLGGAAVLALLLAIALAFLALIRRRRGRAAAAVHNDRAA